MEVLVYLAEVVGSFLLWIAVPVLVTLFFGMILRRLDVRWTREGEDYRAEAIAKAEQDIYFTMWSRNPCWEANNCSHEDRVNCKAYQQSDKPCWEVYRTNGSFSNSCADCSYREKVLIKIDTESIGEPHAN